MKKNYLQGHETKALGPKMAVAFANIFMAKVQMQILGKGAYLENYTDYSLVNQLIEQANKHHLTIKFTAEISFQKLLS